MVEVPLNEKRMYRRVEALADTPKGQLLATYDALEEWFALHEFRGCMFIKASAESQELDHPIHVPSAEYKRLIAELFLGIVQAANLNNPGSLTRQLMILNEGAIYMAVMVHSESPVMDAKGAAQVLIEIESR